MQKCHFSRLCNCMTLLAVCCYGHEQYGSFASLKIEKKRHVQHVVFSPFFFIWHSPKINTGFIDRLSITRRYENWIPPQTKSSSPHNALFFISANTSLITSIFQVTNCILLQTRDVRRSDYSPAIVLSEEKDNLKLKIGEKEKWTNKGTNKQQQPNSCIHDTCTFVHMCTKFQLSMPHSSWEKCDDNY